MEDDPLMVLADAAAEDYPSASLYRDMEAQKLEAYILESQLEVQNIVSCCQDPGMCHAVIQ